MVLLAACIGVLADAALPFQAQLHADDDVAARSTVTRHLLTPLGSLDAQVAATSSTPAVTDSSAGEAT